LHSHINRFMGNYMELPLAVALFDSRNLVNLVTTTFPHIKKETAKLHRLKKPFPTAMRIMKNEVRGPTPGSIAIKHNRLCVLPNLFS